MKHRVPAVRQPTAVPAGQRCLLTASPRPRAAQRRLHEARPRYVRKDIRASTHPVFATGSPSSRDFRFRTAHRRRIGLASLGHRLPPTTAGHHQTVTAQRAGQEAPMSQPEGPVIRGARTISRRCPANRVGGGRRRCRTTVSGARSSWRDRSCRGLVGHVSQLHPVVSGHPAAEGGALLRPAPAILGGRLEEQLAGPKPGARRRERASRSSKKQVGATGFVFARLELTLTCWNAWSRSRSSPRVLRWGHRRAEVMIASSQVRRLAPTRQRSLRALAPEQMSRFSSARRCFNSGVDCQRYSRALHAEQKSRLPPAAGAG